MKDGQQFLELATLPVFGGGNVTRGAINPILSQFVNYVLSILGVCLKTSQSDLQMCCQIRITVLAFIWPICINFALTSVKQ